MNSKVLTTEVREELVRQITQLLEREDPLVEQAAVLLERLDEEGLDILLRRSGMDMARADAEMAWMHTLFDTFRERPKAELIHALKVDRKQRGRRSH